jgi:hypothetical protein
MGKLIKYLEKKTANKKTGLERLIFLTTILIGYKLNNLK